MSDNLPPEEDPTIILPPAVHDNDAYGAADEPSASAVEGSTELISAIPPSETSGDAVPGNGLRSPWTAPPSTSFSASPLTSFAAPPDSAYFAPNDAETTGPVPAVREFGAPTAAPEPVQTPMPMPMPTAAVLAPPQADQVTCPECGTVAMVTLTRRDASDFCRNCDYPLFWTPSKILLDRANLSDESLRRLPGTVGRVTVASFRCPHCAEPNQLTAVDCIRCGRPLRPVHYEQPPVPVYLSPPPPPEPEPERGIPWWVWAAILMMVVAVTLILLYAYDAWPFD